MSRATTDRQGGRCVRALVALVAVLATTLVAAATATAARPLTTGFVDAAFTSSSAAERQNAFRGAAEAGGRIARIVVSWRGVATGQPADPRDPGDPAYDFSRIDQAVSGAVSRGLDPMLTIYSAPPYAIGAGAPSSAAPGTWKPDPGALGDFARAIAARYSGGFGGLQRVRYFQGWNEPTLPNYLTPQFDGKKPVSPGHYKRMLNAFFSGVKSVHKSNFVVTAGTAPYGDPRGGSRMRPLLFWRKVLCVKRKKKRKLRPANCDLRAAFDAVAHHPINTSGGPRRSAINRDDASTPDLGALRRILRKAEKTGRVRTGGRHQLWATELWWESNPPDRRGVRLRRHARFLSEALYLIWKQGFSVALNLPVRDEPGTASTALQSGVFFADGRAKPALRAFRFPFVTERKSRKVLRAWGKSPVRGKVRIQRKRGKGWRTLKKRRVAAGRVFKTKLRVRGGARLRAKVGGEKSLVWRQKR